MEATKTNPNLKPLPFACTKSQLLEMYGNQMANDFITKSINTIIQHKRGLPKDETPRVVKVLHVEFAEFVETYGLPRGYYQPENW